MGAVALHWSACWSRPVREARPELARGRLKSGVCYSETTCRRRVRRASHQNAAGIADRAGDYEGAFHHFAEAKRLAPGSFDLDAHRDFLSGSQGIVQPRFFAERQGYGHPSARPVFIVGMPRSGTTLTEQIISSHPDSAGAGELTALPKLRRPFIAQGFRGYGKWIRGLTRADVRKVAEDYLEDSRRSFRPTRCA